MEPMMMSEWIRLASLWDDEAQIASLRDVERDGIDAIVSAIYDGEPLFAAKPIVHVHVFDVAREGITGHVYLCECGSSTR
jgi:hypothetical protein